MKSILLILMIYPLHLLAQKTNLITNDQFKCTLTSDKNSYNIGETPEIIVDIKNNSSQMVYLVKELDGSESKWRFPYAYFTISKFGDTSYKTISYGRCGNMNEIRLEDFVKVKPGESFNPYRRRRSRSDEEYIYAYDYILHDKNNFLLPGNYLITFFYSTIESDFSKWRGYFGRVIPDDELEKIHSIFPKVAHIEIHSDELMIEVK